MNEINITFEFSSDLDINGKFFNHKYNVIVIVIKAKRIEKKERKIKKVLVY